MRVISVAKAVAPGIVFAVLLLGIASSSAQVTFRERPPVTGGPTFGRTVVCDVAKTADQIKSSLQSWVGLVGRWVELQSEVVRSQARFQAKIDAIVAEKPPPGMDGTQYAAFVKSQCDRLGVISTQVTKLLGVDTLWVPKSRDVRLVAESFGKVAWRDEAVRKRIADDLKTYRSESAAIEFPWAQSDGATPYDVPRWNKMAAIWARNQAELDPATGKKK